MANEKQLAILKQGVEVWNKVQLMKLTVKGKATISRDLRSSEERSTSSEILSEIPIEFTANETNLSDADLIEKSFKHRTNDGVAILLQERGFEGCRVQVVQEAVS
jgi:hypothetical protein